jgi:diguanylate cyclase (GGDEF)-like protein
MSAQPVLKGNILVIENDPYYSSFYEKTLAGEGYRTWIAGDHVAAERLFGERTYDVIISDMVVKGGDGLKILESIKQAAPGQDVVMITSMQSIKKAVEALKLGAADYLTKPVDEEELLLLVKNLIDRQNITAEHSRLVSENVLFFEQFRVQKRGLEILGMLDTDRIIDHLLDMIIEEAGANGAALYLYSDLDGTFSFAASRGTYDSNREEGDRTFEKSSLREQFFNGRALLEDGDGRQHPEAGLEKIHRFRLPLLYAERVTALIALSPRRDERPYTDFQVNVARVLAESGAMALQNAHFFSLEASRDLRDPEIETYSPAYFHQAGLKEVNIARRYGRDLSIVLVEVDGFEAVKKKIKEVQARRLLKDIAGKLLEVSRETDVLSMLEEGIFALVVPETDFYGALMLIKRIKVALRSSVFSIDLKREVRLTFSLGSGTYPGNGEQLVTLLRSARERMKLDRQSLTRRLKLENRSFWKAYAHLIGLGTRDDREEELRDCFVTLSDRELDDIRNLFLDEAANMGRRRGLIYIGNQVVDGGLFTYGNFSRLGGTKLSVFTLGVRGDGSWNHPEIMPVYLDDRDIREHRFLLCIAENFYYTLLASKKDDGTWSVFHSSDPYITHEMIGKLQERYLLQQRIG